MLFNILSGIISSFSEIIVTHPIDNIKTQYQYSKLKNIKFTLDKHIYRGLKPKIIGVVPMRTIYWLSYDYAVMHNFNYIITGLFVGINQTIIDYPIEVKKIKKITQHTYKINHKKALTAHIGRNTSYCFLFSLINNKLKNKVNNFYIGAISGFVSASLTQPLDYIKTIAQSQPDIKLKYIQLNKIFTGFFGRNIVCLLSMGIGFSIFEISKKYLKISK